MPEGKTLFFIKLTLDWKCDSIHASLESIDEVNHASQPCIIDEAIKTYDMCHEKIDLIQQYINSGVETPYKEL